MGHAKQLTATHITSDMSHEPSQASPCRAARSVVHGGALESLSQPPNRQPSSQAEADRRPKALRAGNVAANAPGDNLCFPTTERQSRKFWVTHLKGCCIDTNKVYEDQEEKRV